MPVDVAAVTSAEATQYRAAGWWSNATLSDCVRRHAASSPDKPAYVDFSADSDYPHCESTWPHTQQTIHEQISGLPEPIIRKVTWENAARLYQHPVPVAVQNDPDTL